MKNPLRFFLLLLMTTVKNWAAPPANDNAANAAVLTGTSASVNVSNVEAATALGDFAQKTRCSLIVDKFQSDVNGLMYS